MRRVIVLGGLVAGLLCAGTAWGGIITTEGFEDYALGSVHGCNGGTNWAGAWTAAAQGGTKRARVEDVTVYGIPAHGGTKDLHIWGTSTLDTFRTFSAGQLPEENALHALMYLRIPGGLASTYNMSIRIGNDGTGTTSQIIHVTFSGSDNSVSAQYNTTAIPPSITLGYWDGSVHEGYQTLPDARTQWVSFEILADRALMIYDVTYAGIKIGNNLEWRRKDQGSNLDRIAYYGSTGNTDGATGGWYADDIRIEGTPEPGSLIVWGCAALLMMFGRRRSW